MEPIWQSTVGGLIRRSARRHPARTALVFNERSYSYRELDQVTDRLARGLLTLGLAKGDRVAAYGRNSDAYLLLFLACAKAGLVHVPVNYALSGDELFYIIHQSGSRALFYDPSFEAKVDELRTRLDVEFYGTLREGHGPDILEMAHEGSLGEIAVGLEDADLAQLLYTSGTTSVPKGAMLSHRALIHEYMSCVVAFDLSPQDRPLHAFPLYHSAQMHGFILPHLMIGATNWLMELPEAAVVLSALETFGITSFFAPPTFWIALLHHPEFAHKDLSSLGKVFYGASIMPTPVLQQLRRRFPGVGFYNAFGQSEIAPVATVLRPEDHEARPDSAGKPVLFVEMRVVDKQMRDVVPGESGEVVYRSPQLCSGYWEKPEETRTAFEGGWFHSDDLARIDEEGYIYVVDRMKDVINTGGVLVASREVEEALYTHPAVKEVAVIATPDPTWIEAVTAIVVLKEGVSATAEELTKYVREQLAPFKVPKQVFFVDDLPRNASGKLLKRRLRERFKGTALE